MTAELVDLRWETVCRYERLLPERGSAALLPGGAVGEPVQVALVRTHDGIVYAVGNVDPYSHAAVLSRGIVGDRGGVPTVTSPVYKQAFSLVDGRCLDEPEVSVPTYPVRIVDGWLQVGLA
jgi:nitrite reductase (NADH) small subunit